MADKNKPKETPAAPAEGQHRNYNERRWMKPSKRAEGYAKDRRSKVHTYGPKEGQELTEYDKGIRSGYLLAQSDHAGMYKFKKATVQCKAAFAEQIVITAKSREKQSIAATCTVDYVQKIESISLSIGNVPINLGGNTDVKIYIGEDNRNNGGVITLDVTVSEVYTLVETIAKSVSLLNCGEGGSTEGYFTGQSTMGGPYGSSGYSCDSIDNTEGKTIYFDRRIFSSYNFCRTGTSWQGSNLVSYSDKFSEMSVSDMKYYLDILGESQKILWTVHINVTGSVGGYSYTSTGNIRLAGSEGGTDVTGLALSENILKF